MKNIKRIAAAVLALLLAATLAACSRTPSVRSEKGIGEDLLALESDISRYALSIDKVNITKRQTRKDEMVDLVWVDVTASNESITCSGSWELTYGLYDNGWMLDKWKNVKSVPESKYVMTEADAIADMESMGFTDVVILEIRPRGISYAMQCEATKEGRRYSGGYEYKYDPRTGTWGSKTGCMWGM